MNPPQKNPELFANGRFKIKDHDGVHKIIGYNSCYPLGRGKLTELYMLENGDLRPIEQGTLIAQKIEDMTDEEVREYMSDRKSISEAKEWIAEHAKTGKLDTDHFLFLLTIGVYPFDNSHFEDGTVININEI